MLKGDAIFQCLFDKECLSYTTASIYCYEFGAVAIVQLIKFCYFFFSSYNHIFFLSYYFLVFDILCKNIKK